MVRFSPSTLKYMSVMLSLSCLGSTSYTSSPESDDMLDTDHKGKPGKRKRTDMSTVQKNQTAKRSRTGSTTAEQQQETLLEMLRRVAASNIRAFDEASIDQLKKNHECFDNSAQSWTDQDWKAAFTNPRTWLNTTDEPQQENTEANSHTNCFAHAYASTIYQWPGVSEHDYRSAILAHLFFPPRTNELLSSEYTQDTLMRGDYLYGFLTAARYGHTVAHYHLIYNLREARKPLLDLKDYKDDVIHPPFFAEQFKDIKKVLLDCKDNPDASYILGQDYQYSTMSIEFVDPRKAIEAYATSKEARHKLAIVHLKDHTKRYYPQGSRIEDYIALGDAGYSPAYIKALARTEDQKERLELIDKAISQNYSPAYIHRGWYHVKHENKEKALIDFETAGKKGITKGYLLNAALITNRVNAWSIYPTHQEINKFDENQHHKVEKYYKLAADNHDIEGHEKWIGYRLNSEKEDNLEELFNQLQDGLKEEAPEAYFIAETRFQKFMDRENEDELFINHYKIYETKLKTKLY